MWYPRCPEKNIRTFCGSIPRSEYSISRSFSPCFLEAFLAEPSLFLDLVVLALRTRFWRHSLPRGSAVLAFPAVMRWLAGRVEMIGVNIEDQISAVPAFLFHWKSRVLIVSGGEVDVLGR